ncbi:membrane component of an ABC superfamily transporter [Wigglesworthia glossinidia endosymbiont of Glossina morsitans morsitans (Yale colony)]|uniref:Transport permease protein n=1 Tax=Wigglesworthia glossinidia endosymbiont of Glossina morsitans morsitans (Yale colony) TaxID=1142511 RepID=H6Q536_WIGGL|nr:ABC transporter permease [Wigglesworthia glossinidia]AFA41319.1 membrane component of an ABC superfamily transporter [Wigglesworthia glossinidia endosymbiont of Glossina morsitans morsitans (Yale colony)]
MKQSYLIALKSILYKEITRFTRIWGQTLVPPVITIILYFIIFGNLIGSKIGKIEGFSYMEFIVPGMIMMSVITNAYNNVASSFFSAKFQKNIEELLVAPVPAYIIIIGYIGGGVIRAIFVGSLVSIVSLFFLSIHIQQWTITILVLILTAVLFSLAGLLNGIFAKNFDDISMIPTFILTPLTYLGGVFYSLKLLPIFWQNISRFNPIVYMVNGFRYGFLGITDISIALSFVIMICMIFILYISVWYCIKISWNLKN